MFRCVMPFNPCRQSPGFRWWEALVQRRGVVNVQVINHQDNLFCLRINVIQQFLDNKGKIQLGTPLAYPHFAKTG